MSTDKMNTKDRMGILLGTLLTFLFLPISLMLASIPAVMISGWIDSPVLALSTKLAILGIAAIMTFVQAVVLGLAISYLTSWAMSQLHVAESLRNIKIRVSGNALELKTAQQTNHGALVGALAALVFFVSVGNVPIHSLTQRVEHLFPGQVMLSVGTLFNFDLSHVYAAATGFLAVGFLFAIAGIVAGSLFSAAFKLTLGHAYHR